MGILGDDFYYQADLNAIKNYERNEGWNEGWQEGWNEGWREGMETGIRGAIEVCQELSINRDVASVRISEKFPLDKEYVEKLMQKYWKES